MTPLRGIIPIVLTPFTENDCIDQEALAREVDALISRGAGALGTGFASELPQLSEEERATLVRTLVEATAGRVGLIAGTGADTAALAIERSRKAVDAGFSFLLVTPPAEAAGDDDAIFRYYQAINDAAAAPIIIQDCASMTGVDLSPKLLARLGRELEFVQYVKVETDPTPPRFLAVHAQAGDALTPLGGWGGTAFPYEIARGAAGSMPGPAAALCCFCDAWDLLQRGEERAAFQRYLRHLPLIQWSLTHFGRFLYLEKEILRRAGTFANARFRPPYEPPDDYELREVEMLLESVKISPLEARVSPPIFPS